MERRYKKQKPEYPLTLEAHGYEKYILGTILYGAVQQSELDMAMKILRPDCFSEETYGLFLELRKRIVDGKDFTFTGVVSDKPKYKSVAAGCVGALTDATNPYSIVKAAMLLREFQMRRAVQYIATDIIERAHDGESDVFDIMYQAEHAIMDLYPTSIQGLVNVSDLLSEQIEHALKSSEEKEARFIPTGIMSLDNVIQGYEPGEFVVIGARPGMGKTGFAISQSMAWGLLGIPHGFFSIEMTKEQIIRRYMAQASGVSTETMAYKTLSDIELRQLKDAEPRMRDVLTMLSLDDNSAASVDYIRARAATMKSEKGIRAIIVDYLQKIQKPTGVNSREQEIAEISGGMARIAKDLEIVVICLAQLNRSVETRIEKRPQLSDLRDSGSIEQDAHKVGFLYRPEYYDIDTFEDGSPTEGRAEVIIAKNRDGGVGTARTSFDKKTTAFTSQIQGGW